MSQPLSYQSKREVDISYSMCMLTLDLLLPRHSVQLQDLEAREIVLSGFSIH